MLIPLHEWCPWVSLACGRAGLWPPAPSPPQIQTLCMLWVVCRDRGRVLSPETPGVCLDDSYSSSCSWAEGPEGKKEVKNINSLLQVCFCYLHMWWPGCFAKTNTSVVYTLNIQTSVYITCNIVLFGSCTLEGKYNIARLHLESS